MNKYMFIKTKKNYGNLSIYFFYSLYHSVLQSEDTTRPLQGGHLITQQQSYQIQQPTENQKKFYQKETQPVRPMR